MTTPYRSPPADPSRAPAASAWRLALAYLRGTMGRAEARAFRNKVLRDPDTAAREARSLAELFAVSKVLVSRGYYTPSQGGMLWRHPLWPQPSAALDRAMRDTLESP